MGEEKIKVAVDGQNKEMSITDVCELLNLSLEDLIKNKKDNSWEEVIRDTKPSCYINILGQLVIPEEVIKRVNKQREKKAAMEKYMVKARALGRCDIEMEYDEFFDKINVINMIPREGGEIHIPEYVDCVKIKAWNEACKGCIIYIPAGCDIELSKDDYSNGRGIQNYSKEIIVAENHKELSSKNGVLFNKDKTELLAYPRYKENRTYSTPDSVKKIRPTAFDFFCLFEQINVTDEAYEYINSEMVGVNTRIRKKSWLKRMREYHKRNRK